MGLLQTAEALAREAHADQRRKGPADVPYFTHLASVVGRLRAAGIEDETTLAAAFLHDLIEDRPAFADRLRAEMPIEVVETVEVLTEKKRDAHGRSRSKAERFADYLAGLSGDTPAIRRALSVSCADKIDNVRSVIDAQRRGVQLLLELRTRPGQHAGQLAALRRVYAAAVPAALLDELDAAARELDELILAWLPGRAASIAAAAHLGQFDKSGAPYVLHPMRLMLRASTPEEQMIAVLHDVVEDTAWTFEQLADEGFPPPVIAALDRLTKREGESYEAFIERIVVDPLASRVKLLDLEDNLDLKRLTRITPADLQRLERYHRARTRLLG
jgi:(p)ppGpp synthase/HD superfamily hydrolase